MDHSCVHVLGMHFPSFSKTSDEFEEEYYSLMNSPKYKDIDPLSTAGVAYDAVWAMAIGPVKRECWCNKQDRNPIQGPVTDAANFSLAL